MRTNNIRLTLNYPIKFNKPDMNGNLYTREVWEKAISECEVGLPIEVIQNDGTSIIVGITNKIEIEENGDSGTIIVNGILRHGGTCEVANIEDKIIKSIELQSVGISK